MDKIAEYIKTFDPFKYGLDTWDLWIGLGLMIFLFLVLNLLTSSSRPATGQKIKSVLTFIFYGVFIGVLLFALMNSLLTKRYDRLAITIFILTLPFF